MVWTRWKKYEIFSKSLNDQEKIKRNQVKKHVRKLKINGSITTDPFEILSEEKRFYQELYKSKNLGNKQATEIFLNSLNIPRLTDEQKLSCEGSLTEEKCVKDLQSCQGNKRVPMGLAVNWYLAKKQ